MEPGGGVGSRPGLPTVSVVIPTYKRVSRLASCVRALLADPATNEVVVAVDGSGDGSYELATGLGAKDSRVVAFEQAHAGTHAARTAAVERAAGEVVLMVDDDVIAGEGLVTGHALRHRETDHLVVVGYMPVVAADDDSANRVFSRIYTHEYESHCDEIEVDPRLVLLHLWGGNVSLRRADYLSIGFLRTGAEAWKHQHEDQYMGIRFHQAGLTAVFDRALYAQHRYRRGADAFLRDARTRGAAQWQLHSLFPELLGALDRDWACAGLPAPVRSLVRWAGTPERSSYVAKPLVLAARTAHQMRLEGAESAAYRLARRVELQTGTRSAVSQ
ncbi:MAG: glycosyltransferase [Acidimicrobiales bacterium]|jgi:glycosyltransferase involved in cell wall biosynthesis